MGTTSHIKMKFIVAFSALVACGLAAEEAKVIAAPLGYAGYPYAGYPYAAAAPVAAYAPAPYAAAPVAAYAPAPYSAGSQFHAQDEFGNLNYGYANLNSAKQEIGNTYGGVTGGYQYVDANGKLQQVTYVADGAGFRVEDSRLPVAPVYDGVAPTFTPEPLVAPIFNPEPLVAPELTPEVAAATAEHLAADAAILASSSRIISSPTPLIHNAPVLPYAGLSYTGFPNGGYAGYAGHAGYAGYAGYPGHAGYAGYAGYAGLPYLG